MTREDAKDQAIVAKAIDDKARGRYAPPEPHGLDRAVGAALTLGISESVRDNRRQELYDAAHGVR